MGTLKFDVNGINNKVKPPLTHSMKYLESSKEIISSISIPSDFAYYSMLKNLPNSMSNVKQKVNKIYKWSNDVAIRFQRAEQKNTRTLNAIAASMPKVDTSKFGSKVSTSRSVNHIQDGKVELITPSIRNLNITGAQITANWGSNVIKDDTKEIQTTNANITTEFKSMKLRIEEAVAKKVEQLKELTTKAYTGINFVGCKVVKEYANVYIEKTKEGIADIANVVVSVVKGLGQFLESIFDLVNILGTVIKSFYTGIIDVTLYSASKIKGDTKDWKSITAQMWKNTMGFVAKDHVGNAFASFYKNNAAGQWLNEHAHECFKSDGVVSNVASGLGYVGGIVILTIATLGVGGAALGAGTAATTAGTSATTATMTATSSVIAGLSGVGKYTAEYWEKVRDSSWEGVTGMYKNGEIDKEAYDQYKEIRDLSDEEWKELEEQYKNGNISEDDYKMIKQIRDMPENWTTLENAAKGLIYGTANGAWEGIQWYVGGKLGDWTIKSGSQLATSAIRVGADTGFNALDTPFRTMIDAATSDQNLKEAWENQGGWKSVWANIGIGLIGSVSGEAIDAVKMNKGIGALNKKNMFIELDDSKVEDIIKILNDFNDRNIFEGMDDSTALNIAKALICDHASGKIDLTELKDLYDPYLKEIIEKNYLEKQTVTLKVADLLDSSNKNSFNDLKNIDNIDAFWQKNYERTGKYGIDQGLFRELRIRDEDYYNQIKNKMMKEYNMSAIDAEKLMLSLDSIGACSYATAANNIVNDFRNVPTIFEEKFGFPLYRKNAQGQFVVNDGELLMDMYYSINHKDNGEALDMGAFGTKKAEIVYYDETGTPVLLENREGHSTAITEINDKGLIVSSWGKNYFVSFENLQNSSDFQIIKRIFKIDNVKIEDLNIK